MKHKILIFITGMLLFASVSHATTLTYILDQSKTFEDGVDYLSVTLNDDNPAGQLNVSVEILPALAGLIDEDGGIKAFAFSVDETVKLGRHHWNLWPGHGRGHGRGHWCNHIERHGDDYEDGGHHGEGKHNGEGSHHGDMDALTYDDFDLPEGWKVSIGKPHHRMLEDVLVYGSRKNTQDPLLFSIADLTVDDLIGEFTVLVTGLPGEEYCEGGEDGIERECERRGTSAIFYGGEPVVIPVPAAVWLMGSGLLALVGVARRRRQS